MSKSDVISLIVVLAVAIFTSITAPLIISSRAQRLQLAENLRIEGIRQKEKEEDWARQDAVAARAAEAAEALAAAQQATIERTDEVARADRLRQDAVAAKAEQAANALAAAQAATIRRTDEVARLSAIDASQTRATLDRMEAVGLTTHSLVNSDMTEARESELVSARALLVVLERIVGARQAGVNPDPEDVDAMRRAKARISSLESLIEERKRAQAGINQAIAEDPEDARTNPDAPEAAG